MPEVTPVNSDGAKMPPEPPMPMLRLRPGRGRVVQVWCGQLSEHGPEHGQDVFVHRLPQALLGTEVMDDQTGRDPGGGRDLPYRNRVRSAPDVQPQRLVADDGPRGPVIRS